MWFKSDSMKISKEAIRQRDESRRTYSGFIKCGDSYIADRGHGVKMGNLHGVAHCELHRFGRTAGIQYLGSLREHSGLFIAVGPEVSFLFDASTILSIATFEVDPKVESLFAADTPDEFTDSYGFVCQYHLW